MSIETHWCLFQNKKMACEQFEDALLIDIFHISLFLVDVLFKVKCRKSTVFNQNLFDNTIRPLSVFSSIIHFMYNKILNL